MYDYLNVSCSIVDKIFLYEQYESKFQEEVGEGALDSQQIEEDLINHIVWTAIKYGAP